MNISRIVNNDDIVIETAICPHCGKWNETAEIFSFAKSGKVYVDAVKFGYISNGYVTDPEKMYSLLKRRGIPTERVWTNPHLEECSSRP